MAKQLELLHQLVPAVTSIAFLINPTNPSTATAEVRNADRILGLQVLMIDAAHQSDIAAAFAEMAQRHGLPAIFSSREAVMTGGLMSYGASLSAISAQYREADFYTRRILKGEKPADLPVRQPTSLLVAADEVIARRRDFIAGLGGAATAWPLVARAQQAPKNVARRDGYRPADIRTGFCGVREAHGRAWLRAGQEPCPRNRAGCEP